MNSLKQFWRLCQINRVVTRNGLDSILLDMQPFWLLRSMGYLNPGRWFCKSKVTRAEAIRLTLEQLGPIFVKFGQALSTRPDILPADIAIELCKLQDNVPPFPTSDVLVIIQKAFGRSAFEMFAEFDTEVLASASMAQVHAAKLLSGEEVVVKVLRPGMRKIIQQDLSILHRLADLLDRYWSESKRLKPKEIITEFEHSLLDELDLQREAANAAQLRRNFQDSSLLYIPEIYWDYVRPNVMVMERIAGIPVADLATLDSYGVDRKKLAERGVEIFFTQVFRDCFFHADMHPGNIFISYNHPKDPQYLCIDFGIIGTLSESDQRYLAEVLYAFFSRDYRRVAQLHVESGWVARDTRVQDFESAIRTVCEPIFERPLKDISFAQVVMRLFQVARRYNMEVQPQLILLQKTLLAVEGLGRQLYPDLDLWTTAKPFLQKWLREQVGPQSFIRQIRENLPFFTEQLPQMPRMIYDLINITHEEKMCALYPIKHDTAKYRARERRSFGLGLFVVAAGISLGSYLHWFTAKQLIIPTAILALAGLGLAYIPRRKSWD